MFSHLPLLLHASLFCFSVPRRPTLCRDPNSQHYIEHPFIFTYSLYNVHFIIFTVYRFFIYYTFIIHLIHYLCFIGRLAPLLSRIYNYIAYLYVRYHLT